MGLVTGVGTLTKTPAYFVSDGDALILQGSGVGQQARWGKTDQWMLLVFAGGAVAITTAQGPGICAHRAGLPVGPMPALVLRL